MDTKILLNTDGRGYWSRKKAAVHVKSMSVAYVNEDSTFGELRVFFDTETWNVEEDGLIYTDNLFEKELKFFLSSVGIDTTDVGYSEQGMQGDDYVSLDVGPIFLADWDEAVEAERQKWEQA